MRFFLDLAYHCEVTAADGSEWQILAGKTAEDNDRLSLKEIQCLLTSSSQLPSPRCQDVLHFLCLDQRRAVQTSCSLASRGGAHLDLYIYTHVNASIDVMRTDN